MISNQQIIIASRQYQLSIIVLTMRLLQRCKQFRKLLQTDCVMIPGAFNGLVARSAVLNGFKSLYISGAALTASSGVPDIGLRDLSEFTKVIREVSTSSDLPILADADTGFGEGEMVVRTVHEYFYNGATGLHIEDQVFPKRCGHLDGKQLIKTTDMAKKVELAKKTSLKVSDGEFVICARTDARGVEGLEACIARSKAYIDAGADMIFPEGLASVEEFGVVAKELKKYKPSVYLLANMTEFGKTPYISVDKFKELGYNCVIYPVSTLRIAMKAVDTFFKQLKTNGSQVNSEKNMQTRKELYNHLEYTPGEEWYFPSPPQK